MGGDFDGGSFDSGSSSFDSGSSCDAGSFAVQESLVEMLREQTSFAEFSSNMDSTVAREVQNLTDIVEQGKEELDALARIALERNNLSFGAALADINSIGADFVAGLREDRAEAEARIAEADAAEAAALRDMNSNTFFKGLYTPAKKSGAEAVRGVRSRTRPPVRRASPSPSRPLADFSRTAAAYAHLPAVPEPPPARCRLRFCCRRAAGSLSISERGVARALERSAAGVGGAWRPGVARGARRCGQLSGVAVAARQSELVSSAFRTDGAILRARWCPVTIF